MLPGRTVWLHASFLQAVPTTRALYIFYVTFNVDKSEYSGMTFKQNCTTSDSAVCSLTPQSLLFSHKFSSFQWCTPTTPSPCPSGKFLAFRAHLTRKAILTPKVDFHGPSPMYQLSLIHTLTQAILVLYCILGRGAYLSPYWSVSLLSLF